MQRPERLLVHGWKSTLEGGEGAKDPDEWLEAHFGCYLDALTGTKARLRW